MKKVLGRSTKIGNIKVVDFSDDDDEEEEGSNDDDDGTGKATKRGESREKDSRSRGATGKRSRSPSEESAEDSGSASSSTSSKSWNSKKRALKDAKDKGGVGFESSDGSPAPRRKRRLGEVSSSSSEEDDSSEVAEGESNADDSLETRQRKVDEMFAEEPETSSSPQKLGDDADDQEEENGKGEDKLEKDDVVAVSNEKPDMTQNVNNAASSFQNAMGAPAGAGDEEGLKAKHRVDARPSLALHPDVSHREFLNE